MIMYRKLVSACGALLLIPFNAEGASVSLGTAGDFAVLAGSTVTNTGPTMISGGHAGVSPGTAITGFPPGTVAAPYTIHSADALALQAQKDLTTAYNTAAALPSTQILTGQDLGGMTLVPGVYFFATSAQLTGTLTLNFQGNPDAEFVFQVGSTFTVASNSTVFSQFAAGMGCNIYWVVGTSATIGTGSTFQGHILAQDSISLGTGAKLQEGSALARTGAVTLDSSIIENCSTSVPEPAAGMLIFAGALLGFSHRRSRRPASQI